MSKKRKGIKIKIVKYLFPTIYTLFGVIISINLILWLTISNESIAQDFLIKFNLAAFTSLILTNISSIFFYISIYYPKNSIKRGFWKFLFSVLLFIESLIWIIIGKIDVSIENIGAISIDFTFLLILIIFISLFLVLKNGFDYYDFKVNELYYEQENRDKLRISVPKIELKTRSDYRDFIKEAKENGSQSFHQVQKYFIYNQLSFDKRRLKTIYRKYK